MVKISRLMGFTLVFMSFGTVAELFLIEHYEDPWQVLPMIIIALIIIGMGLLSWRSTPAMQRVFKSLLVAAALSGFIGIYFHLQANIEFEAEMHPGQSFITTLIESLSGALPALAPGSMIIFALIGYIYILLNDKLTTHETS